MTALAFAHLAPVRRPLAEAMSAISASWFSTLWKAGLEYLLWSALTGKTEGMVFALSPEELKILRQGSERCKGWIAAKGTRPEWVPLRSWKRMYRERQKRKEIRVLDKLFTEEEYAAELEALRRRLLRLRKRSQVAQVELDAAFEEFYGALERAVPGMRPGLVRW